MMGNIERGSKRRMQDQQGMTLTEALLAISVLLAAAAATLTLIATTVRGAAKLDANARAKMDQQPIIERIVREMRQATSLVVYGPQALVLQVPRPPTGSQPVTVAIVYRCTTTPANATPPLRPPGYSLPLYQCTRQVDGGVESVVLRRVTNTDVFAQESSGTAPRSATVRVTTVSTYRGAGGPGQRPITIEGGTELRNTRPAPVNDPAPDRCDHNGIEVEPPECEDDAR